MRNKSTSAAVLLAITLVVSGCGHYLQHSGWVTLIDGDTGMSNWDVTGGGNWRAEGGSIQADKSTTKGASILVSKKSFKDFELYVEFWASDDTNSGVYVRAPDPKNVNTASGAYEVQIWDKNPNPALRTRPVIGISLFIGMRATSPGRWSGKIYNADDGGTYVSHVTFSGGDALHVEGCVGMICGGETWSRVGR